MIILRFKIRAKPGKSDEVMAALAEIIPPARATEGVINFDIARVLPDPDWFIATAVMRTAPLSNDRSHFPRYTGSWRCCRSRW